MNIIERIAISQLHTSSHIVFHKSCYRAMKDSRWSNAAWEALLEYYYFEIDILDDVAHRQRASIYTSDVHDADALRDGTMRQFFLLVDAGAKSSIAEEKAAATKVQTIIKPYRRDAYDQLTDQTEQVRRMIVALNSDIAAPLVETLGLGAVIERLGQQNEAFAEVYRTRAVNRQAQPAYGVNTKAQRKVVDSVYNKVIAIVNSASIILSVGIAVGTPADNINTLIDSINAHIAQYKLVLANQGKKKKVDS